MIPQRRLAIELRTEIDRVRRRPWDMNAKKRLGVLLAEHPAALQSEHIRHNLGRERLEWLEGWS